MSVGVFKALLIIVALVVLWFVLMVAVGFVLIAPGFALLTALVVGALIGGPLGALLGAFLWLVCVVWMARNVQPDPDGEP